MAEQNLLLEMRNIHKKFPGVYAVKAADLDVRPGEVHALLGENGAGKSTLIRILGGIYEKDDGEILINGKTVNINKVDDARAAGVSIIHQELMLVPQLSVAENVFLGRELRTSLGFLDRAKMLNETKLALDGFGLNISPRTRIRQLNIAQQQMVEIVKATSTNAQIIVMDEPTSSLADKEVDHLFDTIRQLKSRGIGIVYISHRMSELDQVADRVTVMRDGECVGTRVVKETSRDELITLMVGRELANYYTRTYNQNTETVLEVKGLTNDYINDVNFELRKGEILGFAGLIGAGRSETMRAIFGIDKIRSGTVTLYNEPIQGKKPSEIILKGVGLVPENRREEGLFPSMTVKFNLTLKVVREIIKGIRVNREKENATTDKAMKDMDIRASSTAAPMFSLSGGNQQKVIMGSWLASNPKVLILDEPTRGIDVGAKSEIYSIMDNLAKEGMSIIMVSSELPEILNMSDRVAVMRDGTISTILDHTEASQETIMRYAVKE